MSFTSPQPSPQSLPQPLPLALPRAILLDRDGTIIEDRHYLADPDGVRLLPGVAQALARFTSADCRLFVVSNQSGVGRGYFSEADVRACQARLDELLAEAGVRLTDSVWCPHAPEQPCRCRKPATGLWEDLAARYGLKASETLMLGDKLADVDFAANAGLAAGVLVLTGKGAGERAKAGWPEAAGKAGMVEVPPRGGCRNFVTADLAAVASFFLGKC